MSIQPSVAQSIFCVRTLGHPGRPRQGTTLDARSALDFDAAWDVASTIPGWLTEEQARLLCDAARDLPAAPLLVEIGSHQGRSTVVLGAAARDARGSRRRDRPLRRRPALRRGDHPRQVRAATSRAAELTDAVELLARVQHRAATHAGRGDSTTSTSTASTTTGRCRDDLKWAAHLPDGAPVLVHDCYSSIGVTLGVLAHVLPSRRLRYERRAGSLALFRVGAPTRARPAADPGRAAVVAAQRGRQGAAAAAAAAVAARAFGHEGPYDPY